jgi:hypothetical protein
MKNTRRLLAYGLTISMLFNAATANQLGKVDPALVPEPFRLGQPKENKNEPQKKLTNK